MVPDHWKLLKPMVEQPKNHWKTSDVNGQSTQNIQWWLFPPKPLQIGMIFPKPLRFIEISHCFLDLNWIVVNKYCEMFSVFFLELMFLLIIISSPLLQVQLLSWVEFSLFCCIEFFPNHRLPLKNHWSHWSASHKTINGDGSTLAKPLKNHGSQWCCGENPFHSIASKKWPLLRVDPHLIVWPFRL